MEGKPEERSAFLKNIFDAIARDDSAEFKALMAQHKGSVDFLDENGMSALQHAAFKGSKEMVQLLLDRGANVNSGNHEYNYTALHFGALSGNSDVCKLLLDAGANPTATNSVGRSAAQMAAFVGNHHTVATINNFVPRSELAYFAQLPGKTDEHFLPPHLVDPLHKLVLGVNVNPVRLALNIQHTPGLLENADKLSKVLEIFCKKEMTRGGDTNEAMAFKYHYFSYILNEIHNIHEKQKLSEKDDKKHDLIEMFSKKLLKPGKDGYTLEIMDNFLKNCIREFPYRESTTFHQMVSVLTGKDPPPALTVINCTINGQRGFVDNTPYCSTCSEEKPAKKCSKCKSVQYCDRECQRLHWFVHKKACNRESSVPTPSQTSKHNIDANELSAQLQNLVSA